MIFEATKNGRTKKNIPPPLLVLLLNPGSGMDNNQDPRSGINIADPQHCNILCGRILQRFAKESASVGGAVFRSGMDKNHDPG
jgi:hypothetical protein